MNNLKEFTVIFCFTVNYAEHKLKLITMTMEQYVVSYYNTKTLISPK